MQVVDPWRIYRHIAKQLVAGRKRKRWSQLDVAKRMGMTRANVAQLENGRNRILIEHLYSFALATKTSVRSLLP